MDFGPIKAPWEAKAATIIDWLGIAIGAGGLLFCFITGVVAFPLLAVILAGTALPYVFCKHLNRRAVKKQAQALADLEFRVCPYCYYDLRGSAPRGTCPECNVEFDPVSLERQWRSITEVARHV